MGKKSKAVGRVTGVVVSKGKVGLVVEGEKKKKKKKREEGEEEESSESSEEEGEEEGGEDETESSEEEWEEEMGGEFIREKKTEDPMSSSVTSISELETLWRQKQKSDELDFVIFSATPSMAHTAADLCVDETGAPVPVE